ncbi:hypothetical protein V757_07860 [Pelistega indica]|uniref:Nickel ABC transporter substrate-binding protein n=1 Tax=Pelistega indica TaxID=1414851 RepID=V8G1L6_9BURK|nr:MULTISPECIES: DUF4198 domain-containing protein [Pelistega]ETD70424.1 hypothetical protein V757_07860 [Pelistega indica]
MLKRISLSICSALLLFSSSQVSAHNAWVAQQQDKWVVIYGHGASNYAYKPEQVTQIKGIGGDKTVDLTRKNYEDFVSFDPAKLGMVAITLHGGYWAVLKNGEWVQKAKADSHVDGDVKFTTESVKYAVSVMDNSIMPKAVGYPLEIVPEKNPASLHQGDNVTVTVLLDGKPLAGAKVINDYIGADDNARKETDANGKVNLSIRNAGLNVFEVSYRIDHPTKKADKLSLGATYSFRTHTHHH